MHFSLQYAWLLSRTGHDNILTRNSSEDTLCYTLEFLQNVHAQNDKENCVDFYNSVFPGEGFMIFRAPPAAQKQKN